MLLLHIYVKLNGLMDAQHMDTQSIFAIRISVKAPIMMSLGSSFACPHSTGDMSQQWSSEPCSVCFLLLVVAAH